MNNRKNHSAIALLACCLFMPGFLAAQVGFPQETNWKYSSVYQPGWTDPNFDDSGWSEGQAAFGVQTSCGLQVHTNWSSNTTLYLRKHLTLATQFSFRAYVAIDNDFTWWFNGDSIYSAQHDNCASRWSYQFSIPLEGSVIGNNVVAIKAVDLGTQTFFDARLDATSLLFQAMNDWNLVSVPMVASDLSKTAVYPTAVSAAYSFNDTAGYVQQDTLKNGFGYWLKFPGSQNLIIAGSAIAVETVAVNHGWNIVGSITKPIEVSSVTSLPPGIVTGNFYGYNGIYFVADTIHAGRGYWVKVTQNGKIILR